MNTWNPTKRGTHVSDYVKVNYRIYHKLMTTSHRLGLKLKPIGMDFYAILYFERKEEL